MSTATITLEPAAADTLQILEDLSVYAPYSTLALIIYNRSLVRVDRLGIDLVTFARLVSRLVQNDIAPDLAYALALFELLPRS